MKQLSMQRLLFVTLHIHVCFRDFEKTTSKDFTAVPQMTQNIPVVPVEMLAFFVSAGVFLCLLESKLGLLPSLELFTILWKRMEEVVLHQPAVAPLKHISDIVCQMLTCPHA